MVLPAKAPLISCTRHGLVKLMLVRMRFSMTLLQWKAPGAEAYEKMFMLVDGDHLRKRFTPRRVSSSDVLL